MRRQCTEYENSILKQSAGNALAYPGVAIWPEQLPGKNFVINGATILHFETRDFRNANLIIAEDDLFDESGRPCSAVCIVSAELHVEIGQRVAVVYCEDGTYALFGLDAQTVNMIPPQPPAYFLDVDWNSARVLPHPSALLLDKEAVPTTKEERKQLHRMFNGTKNMKARNIVGVVMGSFVILMIEALIFIFLGLACLEMENDYGEILFVLLIIVLLLAWITLTVAFAKTVFDGKLRGFHKLFYKKRVMLVEYRDSITDGIVLGQTALSVYECVDGVFQTVEYPIQGNLKLSDNATYGKVLCKYSKKPGYSAIGLTYFVEM